MSIDRVAKADEATKKSIHKNDMINNNRIEKSNGNGIKSNIENYYNHNINFNSENGKRKSPNMTKKLNQKSDTLPIELDIPIKKILISTLIHNILYFMMFED